MIKLTMNRLSLFWRRAWGPIDKFLDRFTSYKIVLYILYTYIGWAVIGGLFNKVPYHWYSIVLAALWLIAVCRASNIALARFFDIPKNRESDLITALILCLILAPASSLNDALILAAAAIVAMVSKYVLVINRCLVSPRLADFVFDANYLFCLGNAA
jgi:Na+-transporting NADH:ubiquinone oxidoreductase subunit NqrB